MNTECFIVYVKTDYIYNSNNTENTQTDHYLKEKSNWINETRIRLTNHERICQIESKTYSYLKDKNDKDEKTKGVKKCVITELEDCRNCLEAAQFENKINHPEKNRIDADSLKEDQKDFVKINKLILKSQQKFRSEKHDVILKKHAEETSKIALGSNYDKRIQ